MKKRQIDPFVAESIQRPYSFWNDQDEYINKKDIELYEKMWRDKKITMKLTRDLIKDGLELLYAERKQIAIRKAALRSQTPEHVIGWGGERASLQS